MFIIQKSPHPVSYVCPKCGSKQCERVDPDWPHALVKDRVCLECDTRYSPPPPKGLGFVIVPLATIVGGLGCWFLYTYLTDVHRDIWVKPFGSIVTI